MSMIVTKNAPLWRRILRKSQHGVIIFDYTNPMSDKLPKKLDVGESLNLLLPYEKKCFLSEPVTHIGVGDSFGRIHWAPQFDLVNAQRQYAKAFGSA